MKEGKKESKKVGTKKVKTKKKGKRARHAEKLGLYSKEFSNSPNSNIGTYENFAGRAITDIIAGE